MDASVTIEQSKQPNEHIRHYLKYYLDFKHAPKYAVFIDGPWGSGKTFLVSTFLKEYYENWKDEYVYVSLFGLSSIAEINDALFAALYPSLYAPGMKVIGRVAQAAAKKFAFAPDIKPSEILNKHAEKVYVFDDLERCEMAITKVLGYINDFVEHGDAKVLVIGNENEIHEKNKDSDEYRRQREKLVGKTLRVQSSLNEALSVFRDQIVNAECKHFLEAKRADLQLLCKQAKLENLRILQQTIWDFERVFAALRPDHRAHDEAMTVLLRLFFALSIELKSARISVGDIACRDGGLTALFRRSKDDPPGRMEQAQTRYPEINLSEPILSDEVLVDSLAHGAVNEKDIRESVDRSRFFATIATQPAWRIVWQAFDHDDAQVDEALKEMERQFLAREFEVSGEIQHVFGLRLWAADIGLLAKTRAEVVEEGKSYVDDLYARQRLESITGRVDDPFARTAYAGAQFQELSSTEFQALRTYLISKREKVELDRYPVYAKALLEEMEQDPDSFVRRLCITPSGENTYARIPILAAIDPDEFVAAVVRQRPTHLRTIMGVFRERYRQGVLQRELSIETRWLAAVRHKFMAAAVGMPLLSKTRIEQYVRYGIDPLLHEVVCSQQG